MKNERGSILKNYAPVGREQLVRKRVNTIQTNLLQIKIVMN